MCIWKSPPAPTVSSGTKLDPAESDGGATGANWRAAACLSAFGLFSASPPRFEGRKENDSTSLHLSPKTLITFISPSECDSCNYWEKQRQRRRFCGPGRCNLLPAVPHVARQALHLVKWTAFHAIAVNSQFFRDGKSHLNKELCDVGLERHIFSWNYSFLHVCVLFFHEVGHQNNSPAPTVAPLSDCRTWSERPVKSFLLGSCKVTALESHRSSNAAAQRLEKLWIRWGLGWVFQRRDGTCLLHFWGVLCPPPGPTSLFPWIKPLGVQENWPHVDGNNVLQSTVLNPYKYKKHLMKFFLKCWHLL